jgi:hypothetical protein
MRAVKNLTDPRKEVPQRVVATRGSGDHYGEDAAAGVVVLWMVAQYVSVVDLVPLSGSVQ